jgi:hypothetical protein
LQILSMLPPSAAIVSQGRTSRSAAVIGHLIKVIQLRAAVELPSGAGPGAPLHIHGVPTGRFLDIMIAALVRPKRAQCLWACCMCKLMHVRRLLANCMAKSTNSFHPLDVHAAAVQLD